MPESLLPGWTPAPDNDPTLLPDDVEILVIAPLARHHCDDTECGVAFEASGPPAWWYREACEHHDQPHPPARPHPPVRRRRTIPAFAVLATINAVVLLLVALLIAGVWA